MCLSVAGLSAWDNWGGNYQSKTYYQPRINTDYENQSLYNQREALNNQERMIAQQRRADHVARSPLHAKPKW